MVGLATVFGAGGSTSSYIDAELADVIILWGSNAREAHPIFFHHVLKAVRRGAKLFVVDPRRTATAAFADRHLQLAVGSDIALANAVAHEIIANHLVHREFVAAATAGFDDFAASLREWTPERAAEVTGVPGALITEMAVAYASAPAAQLCWTLGITEHHNAVDNVFALINLALLTGHVGRSGSGLAPLRGQNNVQGGGDLGAIPNRLPGFQDIHDAKVRHKFELAWDCWLSPEYGQNLTQMFDAMERHDMRALYVIGENPAQSEADAGRTRRLLTGLDHLVVQDIFLTRTAEMASVVFPASASWCESEGTVTSSERRVQRVRKALDPPGEARDDMWILLEIARRLGHEWHYGGWPESLDADPLAAAEAVWTEVRGLSPMHAGMTYQRLDTEGGLQWPCPTEHDVSPSFLHGRLWDPDPAHRGAPAKFNVVRHEGPVDECTAEYPVRLTTGRRLDSYNTGVQSSGLRSPLRRHESIDVHPADAAEAGIPEGSIVRVVSRRGTVEAPVRFDDGLQRGLAFMTLHFPDDVDVNLLTIDAADPRSGTSEFKATAVRLELI